ncbi:MAG TPA: hypothetical protein VHV51_00650 [Polyangiaceae bacterium]|jgi:hypothetical protein|nr:hypothetical protein [Polyangiaceae bacterium]
MIIRTASHARTSLVCLGLVLALPVALAACSSTSDGAGDSSAGTGSNTQGGSGSLGTGGQIAAAGGFAAAGSNPGGVAGGNSAGSGNGNGGSANGGGAGGSNGGTSSGGSSSGGVANGGSASGGSASGGTSSAGSGGTQSGKVFSQSRFHFGTIDTVAKRGGTSLISQLDFFTSGWLQGDTFDHKSVCDETASGAAFANQVPVMVAYISAAHVKNQDQTVCDCNVTTSPCVASNDLCHVGAQRIQQDFADIVNAYKSYSSGFAGCYGTTRPIVFEMEPDWYQYTVSTQSQPWTPQQAGQMMGQLVAALKSSLPNARFSIDVSPWVGNNGSDNGKAWYANFDMTEFTFVNTSGGGTNANTENIRSSNNMTWSGLNQVTGKPILADTGYGANGQAAGEDPLWDMAANINARIADGVISISQYNANTDWGTTISGLRGQLNTPKTNP